MATADQLMAAARCYPCADDRQLHLLKLALLQRIAFYLGATTLDGSGLMALARCYGCGQTKDIELMKLSLWAQVLENMSGGGGGVPVPTGFVWQFTTEINSQASWDATPAGIVATEVWNSLDGITYSLSETKLAPATSSSVFLLQSSPYYCKIRWKDSGGNFSAFTTVQHVSLAEAWAARAITNGAAAPSGPLKTAMDAQFANGIIAAGLLEKLAAGSVNLYSPEDLIACRTPFLIGPGTDPWGNNGFLNADLNINGLKGDGLGKHLSPGITPSVAFPNDTSFGLSMYGYEGNNNGASTVSMGCATNSGFGSAAGLIVSQSGVDYFECWTPVVAGGFVSAADVSFQGFTSGSRTAANAIALYHANSTTPFVAIATGAGTAGTRPNVGLVVQGMFVGGFGFLGDPQRFSFAAIHPGLTSSETHDLYNSVQAYLVARGGGHV